MYFCCAGYTFRNEEQSCSNTLSDLHNYFYVFIASRLVSGVSEGLIFVMAISYIEDSVSKETASFYVGKLILDLLGFDLKKEKKNHQTSMHWNQLYCAIRGWITELKVIAKLFFLSFKANEANIVIF